MPEPKPTIWPLPRRRPRCSVRAMMLIIVALALMFAVLSPLSRYGLPPCLTPAKTAVWLVKKPTIASCVDCHDRGRDHVE
jgi:hypothetical protein